MSVDDFEAIWLASDSPTASAGAAPRSDQARWELLGRAENSGDGNGFRAEFAEHFDLLVENGLRAVRLTIDWARVEPFPGRTDEEELERLEEIYLAAADRDLAVWTTLHHRSLPGWFSEDTDGFATTRGPSLHWSRHVEHMAERFDPLTHLWAPVDDPLGWAVSGFHLATHPPGIQSLPTENGKLIDALVGSLDATFEAHRILTTGTKPVAGIFRPPIVRAGTTPDGGRYTEERQFWDDALWRSWIHAVRDGEERFPGRARIERPERADAFDFLIIGAPGDVVAGEDGALTPERGSTSLLLETLHRVADQLPDHDLIVAGFGLDAGEESSQMTALESQLLQLQGAREDGLPIRGVMLEPLMDGYDPSIGKWSNSGLFTRSREPKPAFQLIRAQW